MPRQIDNSEEMTKKLEDTFNQDIYVWKAGAELYAVNPTLVKHYEIEPFNGGVSLIRGETSIVLHNHSYGREENLYEVYPTIGGKGFKTLFKTADDVTGRLTLKEAVEIAETVVAANKHFGLMRPILEDIVNKHFWVVPDQDTTDLRELIEKYGSDMPLTSKAEFEKDRKTVTSRVVGETYREDLLTLLGYRKMNGMPLPITSKGVDSNRIERLGDIIHSGSEEHDGVLLKISGPLEKPRRYYAELFVLN